MTNFNSNKNSKNKIQQKKGEANSNIIAFRLGARNSMPLLEEVAKVANLSKALTAQAIVRDFLVEYKRKSIKASDKAKELNLPEPELLEPFIDSTNCSLQLAILFRKTKASKLVEEVVQEQKTAESEVVSND